MGGGASRMLNERSGSWQGDVGRHDMNPNNRGPQGPPPGTMPLFGQQKGANVLDTSNNHYSFQGDLSAPHF